MDSDIEASAWISEVAPFPLVQQRLSDGRKGDGDIVAKDVVKLMQGKPLRPTAPNV